MKLSDIVFEVLYFLLFDLLPKLAEVILVVLVVIPIVYFWLVIVLKAEWVGW